MEKTDSLAEADRLMTICNACRYCEGLCAVFPAMEMRRSFTAADLRYLANLCHGCGACYEDCQFSPPHEFNVNVPRIFAEVRAESYAAYAWPRMFAPLFKRNGFSVACVTAVSVAAFLIGQKSQSASDGVGAFYAVIPHTVLIALFGAAFLFAIAALVMGAVAFWREGSPAATGTGVSAFWGASKDAATLRYLDGGGVGCYDSDQDRKDHRRVYHHLTFYGFLLCFAATSVATLYHYVLGREAPYPWWDLPVLLGVVGGFGLLIGPVGLMYAKATRNRVTADVPRTGMDVAFLITLVLVSLTGFALLVARATPQMPLLLALHLGVVLGFFLTAPYGKFVHGIYRFLALMRYARERSRVH